MVLGTNSQEVDGPLRRGPSPTAIRPGRNDGQKPEVVKAGSYAYGPAGRPHSGSCASAEPCLLFIAFEGPVDAVPVD